MHTIAVILSRKYLKNQQTEINTKKYHVFAPMGRFQLESNKGNLIQTEISLEILMTFKKTE